jgi:tetratricopeptide (TPR) repeat protein
MWHVRGHKRDRVPGYAHAGLAFAENMTTTRVCFERGLCICLLAAGITLSQQDSAYGGETAQHRRPEVDPVSTGPDHDGLAQCPAEREAGDRAADMMSKSAAHAYGNAQFADAERLWRRALKHAGTSSRRGIAWSNVGSAAAAQGRWTDADEAYGRALSEVAADSAAASNTLNNRAGLYRKTGRLVEAEQTARSALAIAEKINDQVAIASRAHTLATILAERGQLEDALTFLKRSHQLKTAAGLASHPDIGATASVTAQVLLLMGRRAEAEVFAIESLAIARRSKGAAEILIASSLSVLASIYGVSGRRAEADGIHREVIAILDVKLGKQHPDSARARVDFAGYLHAIGRDQAATVMYTEALSVYEHAFGAGSPRVVAVQKAMAISQEAVSRSQAGRLIRSPVVTKPR